MAAGVPSRTRIRRKYCPRYDWLRCSDHSGKCAFFIWLPGSDEVIQDSCEFVSSGGDSWGSAQPNAHASEILSKVGLAPMEGLRRHAERDGQAVFHFSRDDGQHSTTADSVIGAETEPGSKGGGIGKPAQVRAHFSQQRVSSQATHTRDCGQVNCLKSASIHDRCK